MKTLKELRLMLKDQQKTLEAADYHIGEWETIEENAKEAIIKIKSEIKKQTKRNKK